MVEPLSIASGVAALIASTAQLCDSLRDISRAPEELKALTGELDAFNEVLNGLHEASNDLEETRGSNRKQLRCVINNCRKTLMKVEETVTPSTRWRAFQQRLFWGRTREDLARLRAELDSYKATIVIATQLQLL